MIMGSAEAANGENGDSWVCRRCGWIYPNPHPSAKHRRNHRKHCGKLKGFHTHQGGSSDNASSDDENPGNGQHQQVVETHLLDNGSKKENGKATLADDSKADNAEAKHGDDSMTEDAEVKLVNDSKTENAERMPDEIKMENAETVPDETKPDTTIEPESNIKHVNGTALPVQLEDTRIEPESHIKHANGTALPVQPEGKDIEETLPALEAKQGKDDEETLPTHKLEQSQAKDVPKVEQNQAVHQELNQTPNNKTTEVDANQNEDWELLLDANIPGISTEDSQSEGGRPSNMNPFVGPSDLQVLNHGKNEIHETQHLQNVNVSTGEYSTKEKGESSSSGERADIRPHVALKSLFDEDVKSLETIESSPVPSANKKPWWSYYVCCTPQIT